MLALALIYSVFLHLIAASPIPGGNVNQVSLIKQWDTTGNQYPTVFMHGIFGFGEAKPLLGFINYWGGPTQNILQMLRQKGYKVAAPSMGPLSSNWERACEAYAQITGSLTDYGLVRSKQFGHKRFGLDHTGKPLVPGFMQKSSKIKINLVGHSMGGPTSRLLVHLLKFGSPQEMEACVRAKVVCSPLFWTNKTQSYVNGVFAISGVHQGSTFDDFLQSTGSFLNFFKQTILVIIGANNSNDLKLYDMQLGHWGLDQTSSESIDQYFERLQKSQWVNSKSTALFDLSVKALSDPLISFVQNAPETTYFSMAGIATSFDGRNANPTGDMLIFLVPTAVIIGSYSNPSLPILTQTYSPMEWRQNDGLVMLASSRGPPSGFVSFSMNMQSENLADLAVSAPKKQPAKGVYNFVGSWKGGDHMAIVGGLDLVPGLRDNFYINIMALLASLSP
ncbi:Alpha/Beta hydrolase protein [Obelidium mucronatum]|nr:Alpha/Beta hydrolase protein [Obelidium mucronatum]